MQSWGSGGEKYICLGSDHRKRKWYQIVNNALDLKMHVQNKGVDVNAVDMDFEKNQKEFEY